MASGRRVGRADPGPELCVAKYFLKLLLHGFQQRVERCVAVDALRYSATALSSPRSHSARMAWLSLPVRTVLRRIQPRCSAEVTVLGLRRAGLAHGDHLVLKFTGKFGALQGAGEKKVLEVLVVR